MRAIVLVGGEGTRLRPLTFTTPKQLLPVVEVPMIERVVGWLSGSGVSEVVLSLGYRPDAFIAAYPAGVVCGAKLEYAVEPEPLDTAGAIRFAAAAAGISETFIVVNGDVLTDLDLRSLLEFHRVRRATGTIHLTPVDDPSRFGVVPIDDHGRVLAFIEKPDRDRAPTNLINAGTYVLEPQVLDRIRAVGKVSIEREVFPAMAADGELFGLASDAYWIDTGTPEAYLKAHRDLLGGGRGTPPSPGAERSTRGWWALGEPGAVSGDVDAECLVGDGASVGDGAKVFSSVLGAHSSVGEGAVVEEAVLLPGSAVAPGASVRRSILGGRARVGKGATVDGVSVIGYDGEVPAGSTVTGARIASDAALPASEGGRGS